jgi:diguanylate cyclase (GGDEF)-like protein
MPAMNLKKKFKELPDSDKVRIIFYPIALASTQLVSLSHYLFIPDSHYFTPASVIAGLFLGSAIAGAAEIVNRYLLKKEKSTHENEKLIKYATNPLKTHLYVVEVLSDGEAVYRFTNDAYKKRGTRKLPEDFVGRKYSEFHTPEDSAAYCNQLIGVIKSGEPLEDEKISRSGRISKRTLTPHIDIETGRKYVTIVSNDIRELKELQKQLAEAAYHDTLTGVANRRLLEDRARLAMADFNRDQHDGSGADYISILKMDLDNFKFNNDTYGHPFGDALLIEVSRRLTGCVRSVDTVAREGGDEFTLLLPKTTKEGSSTVAKKVINEINRSYIINNIEGHLGISIGISLYPQDGTTFEALQKRADQALYWAKEHGKNAFCVYDDVKDNILLSKGSSQ